MTRRRTRGAVASARPLVAEYLPKRLADVWCGQEAVSKPLAMTGDREIAQLSDGLHRWQVAPGGTEGFEKAEVTAGGVDTDELSSQTMESKRAPGLYFIGEVVDVTGHLGGFNFQWAWASGTAAGRVA